jgi:hypothetical protein
MGLWECCAEQFAESLCTRIIFFGTSTPIVAGTDEKRLKARRQKVDRQQGLNTEAIRYQGIRAYWATRQ